MAIDTKGQGTQAGDTPARCPDCGGLNPADAEWCGQCMRRFVAPPPPPPLATVTKLPTPQPAPEIVDAYFADSLDPPAGDPQGRLGGPGLIDEDDPLGLDEIKSPAARLEEPQVGPGGAEPLADIGVVLPLQAPVRRGAFSVSGRAVTWTCRVCEDLNAIDLDTCKVCGSSFAATMQPPAPKPTGDPNTAALYSLFLPGAGHAYIGMWAQAVGRGFLSSWVMLVAAFLLFGGGGKLAAGIFVLAAVGLWLVTAHDAYREASNQQALVLLRGRRFMYVTVGLLGLLFLLLLIGAASVAR